VSISSPAGSPAADAWVAAVHASEGDFQPLGAAVVIDGQRLLTCAHVVMSEEAVREPLWVAFPKAGDCPRRRVASVILAGDPPVPVRDLAVLVLSEPVPAAVEPAPLRCPEGKDLVSRAWWAFGFPDRDAVGDSADGHVGASLSYGWVRLDTASRYVIRPGFSGGGLWSQEYQAVVGVVGQAHANGDGRAITLHQAGLYFPDLKLAALARWSVTAAGEVALTQWGWTLARDPEGVRHWRPRARGVSIESERGWRFRGRAAALSAIVSWLDRATPDRRVLVITGSPGVGKSAVLGRIITTADDRIRASLPPDDETVRASLGSVSCAVHAKGKTALEVAEEIARAASATMPGEPGDLAPAIRAALGQDDRIRFNVIIDALDEAASPAQARAIMDRIVLPLTETCSDVGAQVIIGTRQRDDGGDLLVRFGGALAVIDLDDPGYFDQDDLAAYALACLQLAGDERPGNPYADDALATRMAARIARMSGPNFLIAGLIARSHGLHDTQAAEPDRLGFTATVDSALAAYMERLSPVARVPAAHALTALALAEAPGLPATLWQLAVEALYGTSVRVEDLTRFARSSAASFLVETSGDSTPDRRNGNAVPVYRLFHQALNDALLHARADITPRADDERALTRAFMTHGRLSGWQEASDYLLRSLPGHAEAAGLVDDLLTDDTYLLHANLRRLMQVAGHAAAANARRRTQLLHMTPEAIAALPGERAALLSVTEALDDLGTTYRAGGWEAPYHARWAAAQPSRERAVLQGHQGWVRAASAVTVNGQDMLASCGDDGTVRIWESRTGEQRAILRGHHGRVKAVCAVTVNGQDMLASGGEDGTVRIWDPAMGAQHAVLEATPGLVMAVCAVSVNGRQLLASAGNDATVRLWDPAAGTQHAVIRGHQGAVYAVCPVTVNGRQLLASAGNDRTVRLWDPAAGTQHAMIRGHQGGVHGVCPVTVNGQDMLASAGFDGTVRLWDPATGTQHAVLRGHQGAVYAVCPVTADGQQLLASAGNDATVRLWDPATGTQHAVLRGHQRAVYAVCPVTADGRQLLASASSDGTVRLWDPQAGEQQATPQRHRGHVRAVRAVTLSGQQLLASAGNDATVRLWDPRTGKQHAILQGHQRAVYAVCPVTADGRQLLASAGNDRTVRLWDPATGTQHAVLRGHQSGVRGICAVSAEGQQLLASASYDRTVRLWDPATGTQHAVLRGHQGAVYGICPVTADGQDMLASAGDDATVRLWDLATGTQHAVLRGHQGAVYAVCAVTVNGRQLLASAGNDATVRLWDPQPEVRPAILEGHQSGVYGICPVTMNGQQFLASASNDRTVRVWDPRTLICVLTLLTHHAALAVAWVAGSLAIGLDAGILVIRPVRVS